jgi:hypothetical protein
MYYNFKHVPFTVLGLKRDIHILGLSRITPLLGFLKPTLTFKTSIPHGYGDHNTIF